MILQNPKYNEEMMYEQIRTVLLPGENVIAAVYAIFQNVGFLSSGRHAHPGFLALTDQERLIGIRHSVLTGTKFAAYIGLLKKLRVKNNFFGTKAIEYRDNERHLRISIAQRIGNGTNFPHQEENFHTLVSELESRQI